MLNIYQWYYKNIWPLKNKSLIVNYKNWKVIIQAPIWTWKSFLFFDGPLFSLYKSSDRTLINKDSKNWEIQLLFSINENYYLIIRKLSITKSSKDSVKTYLYSIIKDKNLIDYISNYNKEKIIIKNNDILTLLNFYQVKFEDLTSNFKQEKELQDNLNDMLLAKEIAISTFFIKQDWENIFEVEPSKRIDVLKKIFWIMWIDDAKKIIDEKKRETYWMIKALSVEKTFKEKFSNILKNIEKNYEKSDENFNEIEEILFLKQDFDIKLDKVQKINIDIEEIIKKVQKSKEKHIQSNEQYKIIEKNLKDKEDELKNLLKKLEDINKDIEKQSALSNKYKQENQNIEIKKQELKKIEQIIENINKKYENIQKNYEKFIDDKNKLENQLHNLKEKQENLENNNKYIEKINQEISKNQHIDFDNIIKKIKKLESENQINIDYKKYHINEYKPTNLKELEKTFQNIFLKWKNLKEKIEDLEKQKKQEEENIDKLKKQIQEQEKIVFFCSKIEDNCPFIEKISENFSIKHNLLEFLQKTENKIEQIDKQIKELEKEKNKLAIYWKQNNVNEVKNFIEKNYKNEEEIKNFNKILQEKQEEQKQFSLKIWEKKSKEEENLNIKKQIEDLQNKIDQIRKNIDFNIEQDYKEIQKLEKSKNTIRSDIEKAQEQLKKIEDEIEKIKELEIERKNTKNDILSKKEKISNLQKEFEKIKNNLKDETFDKLEEKENNLIKVKENIWYFNNTVDEFKKNKLELIKLNEKYDLLKNLSSIFWKELIIYVFKDYLKSLENLINYFLETIVDFRLFINLDENGENLDIYIEDEKWKRPVQSLSWWQKNALKIWWILWINKLQNSKLLFLDETINNFDEETIQLIANRIKDFIHENNIKFYMITHSQTLAQLDIWTEILNLNI